MHKRVHVLFTNADALGIISVFTAGAADGFVAILGRCRCRYSLLGCNLATAVDLDAVNEPWLDRVCSVGNIVSTCCGKWIVALEN